MPNRDINNDIQNKNIKSIPIPTLRRLTVYHQYLKEILKDNITNISATIIAQDLHFIPILVRKDIAYTGNVGKPKLGYSVEELIKTIEDFLGWNNTKNAFLVGVGNLGKAIIGYPGFKECGLHILACFDVAKDKINKKIDELKVFHIDEMVHLIKRMKINIGIIATPAAAAQNITDIMVKSGIKAIWNFAPIKLNVPDDVIIQSENLASSLSVLSKRLSIKLNKK